MTFIAFQGAYTTNINEPHLPCQADRPNVLSGLRSVHSMHSSHMSASGPDGRECKKTENNVWWMT